MLNEVSQFINDNQETISGLVAIAISLGAIGRKRAKKMVLDYLDTSREDFLNNIDKHAPAFAKYIYAKLPKSARAFLTIKRIEKIIVKFAKDFQALDNK